MRNFTQTLALDKKHYVHAAYIHIKYCGGKFLII